MQGWPLRKMDAIGRKVRTLRTIKTGTIEVPEGTTMEVYAYRSVYVDLRGPKCDCCGIRPHARKVPMRWVELLPVDHG